MSIKQGIRSDGNDLADGWVSTVCDMCYNICGILVRRESGVVVEIKGDFDNPNNRGKICGKAPAAIMSLYNPYRIRTPLKRTNLKKGIGIDPAWVEISWEEALSDIAERLRRIRKEDPRKLVFYQWAVWASSVLNMWAAAYGTCNVGGSPSHVFCGNGRHPIDHWYHGTFRESIDFARCNYCILFGSQLGVAVDTRATAAMTSIAAAKARGMKLVVVDPRFSDAAAIAHQWIPILPGTDGAFALALLNQLLNELHTYDEEYLKKYTNGPYLIGSDGLCLRDTTTGKPLVWDKVVGKTRPFNVVNPDDCALEGSFLIGEVEGKTGFSLFKEHIRKYTLEMASQVTTVPASVIAQVAREIAASAQIGAKINIGGHELPLRPFAVCWHKGASGQKHSLHTCLSLKILSVVLGALDVPGGVLAMPSTMGPMGSIVEDQDGMLTPTQSQVAHTYPLRKTRDPERVDLREIFPLDNVNTPGALMSLLDEEKYHLPYRPELLITFRTNMMTNTLHPSFMEKALQAIPFIVSISLELDETAEMADIVLPDVHPLETLYFFPNSIVQAGGLGSFWYMLSQPVVSPPFQTPFKFQNQMDILMELAQRAGFLGDFYSILNMRWEMKPQYALDTSRRYELEDIFDRWAKNMWGEAFGMAWMRAHKVKTIEKTVPQAYCRIFHKARVPLYFEYFLRAGNEVRGIIERLGIEWELSDYQALLDWKPGPSHSPSSPEYDLFAITCKTNYHTFGVTTQNPWLNEISERHRDYDIWIHRGIAASKGIKDSDRISLKSTDGYTIEGQAKLTEAIHPQVVLVPGVFGQWALGRPLAKGRGSHHSSLLKFDYSRIDFLNGAVDAIAKVKISKLGERRA